MTLPRHDNLTIARMLRLVDLSRDIERNQDDSAFRRDGGEIVYVFDQNIFEMFVDPARRSQSISTFFGATWRRGKSDRIPFIAPEDWRQADAQTALVTAEYLTSGWLPGMRDGAIHMTAWHQAELAVRVDERARACAEAYSRRGDRPVEDFRAILDRMSASEWDLRRDGAKLGLSQPQTEWLMEDIKAIGSAGRDFAGRFCATRVAAARFSQDHLFEPMEQLNRLVTPPLRNQFSSLHERFRPAAGDVEEIKEEARHWYRRLVEEAAKPRRLNAPSKRNQPRPTGSLWNDARTLAYVRWVSRRRLTDNQRLAFVTGDPVVFDAYRRWYVDLETTDPDYFAPFCLRRLVQFIPILNIRDSRNDLSKGISKGELLALFGRIREAVETMLLPFNLSNLGQDGERRFSDAIISRGREHLTLKLADGIDLKTDRSLTYFLERMPNTWTEKRMGELEEIRESWQRLERIAVGTAYELVERRMSAYERLSAHHFRLNPETVTGRPLESYVSQLLGQIIKRNIELWSPLASVFVQDKWPGIPQGHPRVPQTSWATLEDGRDVVDLLKGLTPQASGEAKRAPNILEGLKTKQIFSVAAALALLLKDWANAERFAELALRSVRGTLSDGSLDGPDDAEFMFQLAMAKRFRMGELDAHLFNSSGSSEGSRHQSLEAVRRGHANARRDIECCFKYHDQQFRRLTEIGDSYHLIRLMRASSERAALNLFLAASLALSRPQNSRRELSDEVTNLVRDAKRDLVDAANSAKKLDSSEAGHLSQLERQIYPNFAAAEAIQSLVTEGDLPPIDEQIAPFIEKINEIKEGVWDEAAPLLRAELCAGLYLANPSEALREQLEMACEPGVREARLPLDDSLRLAIRTRFLAT